MGTWVCYEAGAGWADIMAATVEVHIRNQWRKIGQDCHPIIVWNLRWSYIGSDYGEMNEPQRPKILRIRLEKHLQHGRPWWGIQTPSPVDEDLRCGEGTQCGHVLVLDRHAGSKQRISRSAGSIPVWSEHSLFKQDVLEVLMLLWRKANEAILYQLEATTWHENTSPLTTDVSPRSNSQVAPNDLVLACAFSSHYNSHYTAKESDSPRHLRLMLFWSHHRWNDVEKFKAQYHARKPTSLQSHSSSFLSWS